MSGGAGKALGSAVGALGGAGNVLGPAIQLGYGASPYGVFGSALGGQILGNTIGGSDGRGSYATNILTRQPQITPVVSPSIGRPADSQLRGLAAIQAYMPRRTLGQPMRRR